MLTINFISYSQNSNPWAVDLARSMAKEIFEMNGIPYLTPMVQAVNSTSNARFFNTAKVPQKVDKPYIRFGLHGMYGFVRDDMKTYKPSFPMDSLDLTRLSQFGKIDIINGSYSITDTAGLIYYLFKTVIYNGYKEGSINFPQSAATVLGQSDAKFVFERDTLRNLVIRHPVYQFLPENLRDTVLATVEAIPNYYSLPNGGNLNTIFAFIPQIEIGSLYGTEILLRFIPPVRLRDEIGDFAFWGIAVKHSISQYFDNIPIDIALQAAYQGTSLKNKVGVTNSDLSANTTIFNGNIHISKSFENIIDVFSGLSFENLDIKSKFQYVLPVEQQYALGLLRGVPDENGKIIIQKPEPPQYPGDTKPQTSTIDISDFNVKWIIGVSRQIGPVAIFLDYSISKFNIFSGGIEVRL